MVNIFKILFYPILAISSFFGNIFRRNTPGEPLFLTPLIEEGDILKAQELATVTPDIAGRQSYSGFFTVNKECGNHLFFWFILAETSWEKAPVILWLNGGPGGSSMYGLFQEIGPWNYVDGQFVKNEFSWTKNNNILFVDQPVGTGFSFSDRECFTTNMSEISEQLYSAVVQFFTLFPKLQKNKFFMSGMSFAGHYVPETAMIIDKKNKNAKVKINLVGIVVGSPAIQYTCQYKGDHLYELGVVDESGRKELKALDEMLIEYVSTKNFPKASVVDYKINMKLKEFGLPSYNNFLDDDEHPFTFSEFLTSDTTRKQLHVGTTPYEVINMMVFGNLQHAYYSSAASAVEYLLQKKYIVGFFNGQLDTICSYTSLTCVIKSLKWEGASEFTSADRRPWYISGRLAGWFKVVQNLFIVLVRNSGHHVAMDQAESALTLITAVVSEPPNAPLLSKLKTTKS